MRKEKITSRMYSSFLGRGLQRGHTHATVKQFEKHECDIPQEIYVRYIDRIRYGKQYGYEVLLKNQDRHPTGKIGVLVAECGLPENYEYPFYANFMKHVFRYTLPSFLVPMILADNGMGLIDPDNPLAREKFKPHQLVDAYGSFTNKSGKPYIECEVKWHPPASMKNPNDHGYFLYDGDGKSGTPDICDKVGAKIAGWYYHKLIPEKKVSWRYQLRLVYDEAVQELSEHSPDTEFRYVFYMYPETISRALDELLAAGCKTIIYQSINCPVYTDFEDYGYVLPMLHEYIAERARIIMADQLGNQPPMREAYLQILRDQLAGIPQRSSVLVILSRHGHPFKKETQDTLAQLYRKPLEQGVRQIMAERAAKWDVLWSFDDYADEYWDPKRLKYETKAAYRRAIAEGYEYAIELPTEFPAENTDLMVFHAMKKFTAFSEYNCNQPIPYPDWDKPLVRTFREGKTTGIYAGCPVGPYRKYVVDALVGSLSPFLKKG
jgi:protoheme ferro-lyase